MITVTIPQPMDARMETNVARFIASRTDEGYRVTATCDAQTLRVTAIRPIGYYHFLRDLVHGTQDDTESCDICSKDVTNHTPDCERYRENQLRAVGAHQD